METRTGQTAGGSRRRLSLDLAIAILLVAASARVLIAWLRGRGYPGSDLAVYYVPDFVWWWKRARWMGGWSPWNFAGYPANADPGIGQLHPLGLLYAALPPITAVQIELVLGPTLAGIGMLVYLRQIGCGCAGALVGALSFGLGGFVAAHAPHPGLVRTAMALPWALAAVEALEGRALVAGLGAATGVLLLAGHPQVMAYGIALVVVYAAWLGRPTSGTRPLALTAGLALGAGLAAGQCLPALELIASSTRWSGVIDVAGEYRLTLDHLAGLVVPFRSGGSATALYSQAFPGFTGCGDIECTGYPGMLVWLAIVAGLPLLLRDPRGRFWSAIAVIALLGATGGPQSLLESRGVRAPARLLLWFDLAVAVLAALALDRPARRTPAPPAATTGGAHPSRDTGPGPWAWWIALAVVAAAIALSSLGSAVARRSGVGAAGVLAVTGIALILARRSTAAVARACLVLALALDLVAFGASLPLGISARAYAGVTRVVPAIRDALAAAVPAAADRTGRILTPPAFPGANWAPFAELQLLQGHSSLLLGSFARLLSGEPPSWKIEVGGASDPTLAAPASRVLDLLRCRFVVTFFPPAADPLGGAIAAEASRGGPRWREVRTATADGMHIYENRRARPVGWLVHRVRVVSDDEAFRAVRGLDGETAFDPGSEALAPRPIRGVAPPEDAGASASSHVSVVRYEEDEIRLAVDSSVSALLVTSELSYPGWTAQVDARATEIHTVNSGFRAVLVPEGRHEVVFRYRPWLGHLGLALSALSLLGLLVLAASASRRGPAAT